MFSKRGLIAIGLFAVCCGGLGFGGYYLGAQRTTRSVPITQQSGDGWVLRSKHFVYGMPRLQDSRYDFTPEKSGHVVPGVSVGVREGFVFGHSDRFKVPLWVCEQWTRELYKKTEELESPDRVFKEDQELPAYARGASEYEADAKRFDRGHMARNLDNAAWGEDNALAGDLMSNIVPQRQPLNRRAWLALEDEHHNIVAKGSIKTVWVICGAAFHNGTPDEFIANKIAVPAACYKIIAWFDRHGTFQARGYLFPQEATETDPTMYLVSIDSIEAETGLDFFPELKESIQQKIEGAVPTSLWKSE